MVNIEFKFREVGTLDNKRILMGIASIILIGVVIGIIFVNLDIENRPKPSTPELVIGEYFLYYKGVNITWLGSAGFKLKTQDVVIYLDPYQIPVKETDKADIVFGSHDHADHLSASDIKKLTKVNDTILYTPFLVEMENVSTISIEDIVSLPVKEICCIKPGDIRESHGVTLEFVPAYNIDKYRFPGQLWHPPEINWTGVIIDFGDLRVYHAGDTDHIPEMNLISCDIALLPVMGLAMMTAEEAAEAIISLKNSSDLKFAIPMHYTYPFTLSNLGNITIGSLEEATGFSEKANCTTVILKPLYYKDYES